MGSSEFKLLWGCSMKKLITLAILLVIAVSPLFKGLFFAYEMYISFSFLSVLCAVYISLKIARKEELALKNWSIYLGAILVLAYCLSFIKAVNPRGNIEVLIQYLVYYLVFLVVYDYFTENTGKIPAFFLVPLSIIGFIAALVGLAGYTRVFPVLEDTINGERIGSTMQYANTAAIYFLIIIVFLVSLIINNRNVFLKAFMSGIGNVIFMALFFTSSRGVFIVLPLTVFLILFLVMPKGIRLQSAAYILCIILPVFAAMRGYDANSRIMNLVSASKWIILSAGISAICTFAIALLFTLKVNKGIKYGAYGITSTAVLTAFFIKRESILSSITVFAINNIPQNVITRMSDINLQTRNVVLRFEFYKDALKLIRDNWMFGLGGGGFASLYQSVQDMYYAARLVHNNYLQVFVEAGVLGFLAFILITALSLFYFIYARTMLRDSKQKVYAAGFFCAFLALALHSAIDFNLSYSAMSLIYWSLIGISGAYFFNSRNKAVTLLDKLRVKNVAIPAFLVIISLSISVISIFFIRSSYYANLGADYKRKVEPVDAIKCYLSAVRLDPLNANNHAELADIYSWMAYTSETENGKKEWMEQAIREGEEAIRLDRYYPYYNKILTDIYFSGGRNIKACEQALKLVSVQPRVSKNYELLARGYLEAGLQYLRENDINKGREYIRLCADITEYPDVKMNSTMDFYKGKALLLLGDFPQAEVFLKKARGGSLELKMDSDRLLYIINEETGRISENKKYKGVPWMGMVKSTPVYKETKQIINEGIL